MLAPLGMPVCEQAIPVVTPRLEIQNEEMNGYFGLGNNSLL